MHRALRAFQAEGLATQHNYTVSFHGIGGGPLNEPSNPGSMGAPWHGPGPITQAAVFERPPAE